MITNFKDIKREVNVMNKAELVDTMAKDTGLSKKDAEKALNSFMATISNALSKKDKVQLVGFGTFETRKRAARNGRNPQTGKELKIAAASKSPLLIFLILISVIFNIYFSSFNF